MNILKKVKSKVDFLLNRITFSTIKYWRERAKEHGERAVLNLNHSIAETQKVKDFQIQTLFPLLKSHLNGHEKTCLDFGCGPGRFSPELSRLINGEVIAVDPIKHFLEIAPENDKVIYNEIVNSAIPARDKSIDVIWICLVLGGIVSNRSMNKTIKELNRVAKKNALLFLVENTADIKNTPIWKYRPISEYIKLLAPFNLKHLKDYEDVGERISIFAGRLN